MVCEWWFEHGVRVYVDLGFQIFYDLLILFLCVMMFLDVIFISYEL